eukprot:888415-Prorocentrum_minimum.AAC.1
MEEDTEVLRKEIRKCYGRRNGSVTKKTRKYDERDTEVRRKRYGSTTKETRKYDERDTEVRLKETRRCDIRRRWDVVDGDSDVRLGWEGER